MPPPDSGVTASRPPSASTRSPSGSQDPHPTRRHSRRPRTEHVLALAHSDSRGCLDAPARKHVEPAQVERHHNFRRVVRGSGRRRRRQGHRHSQQPSAATFRGRRPRVLPDRGAARAATSRRVRAEHRDPSLRGASWLPRDRSPRPARRAASSPRERSSVVVRRRVAHARPCVGRHPRPQRAASGMRAVPRPRRALVRASLARRAASPAG